jgi:hypothetical protein
LKEAYRPEASFKKAVQTLANAALAERMWEDLDKFQKLGLDALTPEVRKELIAAYSQFKHPLSVEIIDWLNDKYTVGREIFAGT